MTSQNFTLIELCRTTNGGTNWTQMLLPNQGFNPALTRMDFINQNVGWVVGWYGYAAHTTNAGVTWQLQTIATQSDVILGLHVLSESEVYAVGAPSGGSPSLYHTTNAGATWTKSPLPNHYSLSGIFATASGNVWASGYDGAVLHKSGTVGTGIPCEDLLSFQVRCKATGGGHKLQAKLTLTDTSHSGEQVTLTVDGNPTPVTINGNQAQLSINNPALGEHTIELTDPAGCFPPSMPSCN